MKNTRASLTPLPSSNSCLCYEFSTTHPARIASTMFQLRFSHSHVQSPNSSTGEKPGFLTANELPEHRKLLSKRSVRNHSNSMCAPKFGTQKSAPASLRKKCLCRNVLLGMELRCCCVVCVAVVFKQRCENSPSRHDITSNPAKTSAVFSLGDAGKLCVVNLPGNRKSQTLQGDRRANCGRQEACRLRCRNFEALASGFILKHRRWK